MAGERDIDKGGDPSAAVDEGVLQGAKDDPADQPESGAPKPDGIAEWEPITYKP